MPENPKLFTTDLSKTSAIQRREQRDRARAEMRHRYLDHLAGVFAVHGVTDPAELAGVAIGALFEWRYIDTSDQCECGCHPRLGDDSLHDGGFGCGCTKPVDQRRHALDQWRADSIAFWDSPEGRLIKAREATEEAELQAWLDIQTDVVLSSHGGAYPEQWEGTVAGHSFYFRERWGNWRIELDLQPNGNFGRVVTGATADGEIETAEFEHHSGDVIAEGTIGAEGYGENPVRRAQFIVDTIRTHLARQTCTHLKRDLSTLRHILSDEVRWCPYCGTRLSGGTR